MLGKRPMDFEVILTCTLVSNPNRIHRVIKKKKDKKVAVEKNQEGEGDKGQ